MRVPRRFTAGISSPYQDLTFVARRSEIRNPDGTVVFEEDNVMVPDGWSQVATDILAQKYFRKAGVPAATKPVREKGVPAWLQRRVPDTKAMSTIAEDRRFGGERDARQVFDRLAGCWTYWGWKEGLFEAEDDAKGFYDEIRFMMARQMCAPNSPRCVRRWGVSNPCGGFAEEGGIAGERAFCTPRCAPGYAADVPGRCSRSSWIATSMHGPNDMKM